MKTGNAEGNRRADWKGASRFVNLVSEARVEYARLKAEQAQQKTSIKPWMWIGAGGVGVAAIIVVVATSAGGTENNNTNQPLPAPPPLP